MLQCMEPLMFNDDFQHVGFTPISFDRFVLLCTNSANEPMFFSILKRSNLENIFKKSGLTFNP